MSTHGLIAEAARLLALAGVESPEHDATELLAHVLGVPRGQLALAGPPTIEQAGRYDELVARRSTREPLQHITGVAGFRHVDLAVGPGVFVPRPETELLSGWAVEQGRLVADAGRRPAVVDLCTGSGAIARSVAYELPEAQVYAVELDEKAFEWAVLNLRGSGVDVRREDMSSAFQDIEGLVDVVVCNPPYIPLEAFESVAAEARDFDPDLALWSGEDGLDAIRVVEVTAARLLRPGGVLGVEHADVQGESAPAVLTASGRWADVRDNLDLAGRPRYATARLAR